MTQSQLATFGAGCFWGTEAAFRKLPGVTDVKVGYMGGSLNDPSYEDVITDQTGHAEVAQVSFDPDKVSYETLLDLFWLIHNPTEMNRQGNDTGTQYRSVIFYHTDEQQQIATASRDKLAASYQYSESIVTAIEPAGKLWTAEDYHQRYLEKNPTGYCHVNMGRVKEFVASLAKEQHDA